MTREIKFIIKACIAMLVGIIPISFIIGLTTHILFGFLILEMSTAIIFVKLIKLTELLK